MMQVFPRGRSVLSETFNYMIEYIIKEKGHVLTNLNRLWLSNERIRQLCRSIYDKGSPYPHCFGFVDGTVKSISRPTYEQREVLNQEKWFVSIFKSSLIYSFIMGRNDYTL